MELKSKLKLVVVWGSVPPSAEAQREAQGEQADEKANGGWSATASGDDMVGDGAQQEPRDAGHGGSTADLVLVGEYHDDCSADEVRVHIHSADGAGEAADGSHCRRVGYSCCPGHDADRDDTRTPGDRSLDRDARKIADQKNCSGYDHAIRDCSLRRGARKIGDQSHGASLMRNGDWNCSPSWSDGGWIHRDHIDALTVSHADHRAATRNDDPLHCATCS